MEGNHGREGSYRDECHVTSFEKKENRHRDARVSVHSFSHPHHTTMFAVARSLRSAVSRSGSYAVCPPIFTPHVSYLPLLGPASFLDREEHELKSFRYTYVSLFFHAVFTI